MDQVKLNNMFVKTREDILQSVKKEYIDNLFRFFSAQKNGLTKCEDNKLTIQFSLLTRPPVINGSDKLNNLDAINQNIRADINLIWTKFANDLKSKGVDVQNFGVYNHEGYGECFMESDIFLKFPIKSDFSF